MHQKDVDEIFAYAQQSFAAPEGAQAAPSLPAAAISPEMKRFAGGFLKDVLRLLLSRIASGEVPFR